MTQLRDHTREEPGNLAYDCYRDKSDENMLYIVHSYENEAAFQGQLESLRTGVLCPYHMVIRHIRLPSQSSSQLENPLPE